MSIPTVKKSYVDRIKLTHEWTMTLAVDVADSVLDAMLDVLKPDRQDYADDIEAAIVSSSSSSKVAASAAATSEAVAAEGFAEGDGVSQSVSQKDPAELRQRMDDIKNEMVAVAEQMAEMERRLLEQQANLERRQRELEGDASESGMSSGGEEGMFATEGDERVVINREGATGAGQGEDIEDTKREIQQALSRIDEMQKKQRNLTD